MNSVYKTMMSHARTRPDCFTIYREGGHSFVKFDQKATDCLVMLWKGQRQLFIDEALESATGLFEDADEAIRMSRHDQTQVDELARSLGVRVTQKVDAYAQFLFNLEFGEQFKDFVKANAELNEG